MDGNGRVEVCKFQIGLLDGKRNWASWKYKIQILLRSVPNALKIINGELKIPQDISEDATPDQIRKYEADLEVFTKADTSTMMIILSNLTEDTLEKIMRYNTAYEVWQELYRLYDGVSEDKAYNLCMQFFSYKKCKEDDICSHLSKLKNVWNNLKLEKNTDEDLMLICKILATLPEEYFSFKTSWLLMSKNERTIENLTNQLCAFEKALVNKNESNTEEILAVESSINKTYRPVKFKLRCHFCKSEEHLIKNCPKYKEAGYPRKQREFKTRQTYNELSTSEGRNVSELTLSIETNLLCTKTDSWNWYVDNGATTHICSRKNLFKNYTNFNMSQSVTTASGEVLGAIGKGDIEIETFSYTGTIRLTLKDVWYVPDINKNLFSVLAAQDRNPCSEFISKVGSCCLKIDGNIVLIGKRRRGGGLYKLNARSVIPGKIQNTEKKQIHQVTGNKNLLQIYHERLGHQNKRHVRDVISRELGVNLELDSELCEGCVYGKAHRLKFGSRRRANYPGELIHADVCGPFQISSNSGFKYFLMFKDDYSRFKLVYFLRNKFDVHSNLIKALNEIHNSGHCVKELQCDNGGEFDNTKVKHTLSEKGIKLTLTMPYTPQQNGCVERENRTVVETARSMMHARGGLPQALWAEMINSAVYVLNVSGNSSLPGKSPFEVWNGYKPNISHLRIIGSICYAHIPKQKRKKMDKKAVKGILIGYEKNGYRIWCKENNSLIRSRDVIFQEDPLTPLRTELREVPDYQEERSKEKQDSEMKNEESENELIEDNDDDSIHISDKDYSLEQENKKYDSKNENSNTIQLRDRSKIKKPQRYGNPIMYAEGNIFNHNEPMSYREAIESNENVQWKEAMESEMESLKANNTWTLEKLPPGKKPIDCKWVFKIKTNPDGSIDRYKARLVIKGFSQKKGEDYDQTFSPVARTSTVRALLSIAANEGMSLLQFDVSTAFLYGELEEKIFMKQPEGYNDGSNKVCRLNRSLYGLKQAPRCWNKRIDSFLEKFGFIKSDTDTCLYIVRRKDGTKLLLALYVDDGLVAANSQQILNEFIEELKKEFSIKTKEATYFLGIEIDQRTDGILVRQTAYTRKILDQFKMSQCRPVSTPILGENICHESGRANENKVKIEEKDFPYRQAIGSLMYLMCGTRPDIAYAVGVASRKLENPTSDDWQKVKRIFRFLQGTLNYGILYKRNYKPGVLESYSDADHGGDAITGRSTTGVICMYASGAISWISQRQPSVSISTTEAEVIAASEAARELVWITRLIKQITNLETPPELQVDNEAAIKLAHNPEYHRRTKHIRIRHFFVRELVAEGDIKVIKVSTQDQLADILTKPLPSPRLKDLTMRIGLTTHVSQ